MKIDFLYLNEQDMIKAGVDVVSFWEKGFSVGWSQRG